MICEIIRTAINILVALTLLQFFGNKHSIEILAVALFFSYLLPLMILIYKNKLNKVELDNKSVQAITKQIVQFGIPIALFLSGSLALSVNDRFLISYLINKESAGTYAAIYDVMNKGVIAVFSPILMTFYPVIAKLYNEKKEEEAFLRTLEKGLKKIDEIINQLKNSNQTIINGKNAFELFDTFGFPIDLTRLIATEHNFSVDEAGFEAEMLQQKNRSRAATAVDTEDWISVHENELCEFVGYDSAEVKTKIVKYRNVKAKGKEGYQFVLAATPFYAESGGQIGDTGELIINNTSVHITDTKKENNLTIHFADALPNDVMGDVIAKVDSKKRAAITANHSATHLLHAALRKVLGTHVAQKGSLVNEEQLRFDFSHFAKVTDEEITAVEAMVNEKIRENIFTNS